jgi:hypothetical protein
MEIRTILPLILEGWLIMALSFGIFAMVYITNIIAGVIENCVIKRQQFEITRLINSLVKVAMAAVLSAVLLIGFNTITLIIQHFGIAIPEAATSTITLGAFLLLYINGFFQTANDIYTKIKGWFEITEIETFLPARTETEMPPIEESGITYVTDGKG